MPEGTTEGGLWRESRKPLLLAPACAAMWIGRDLSHSFLLPFCFVQLFRYDQSSDFLRFLYLLPVR